MELFEKDKILNKGNEAADQTKISIWEKQFPKDLVNASGIEALTFQQDATFALASVLSSSVSFHHNLLIIYTGDKSLEIQQICDKYQISYQYIKIEKHIHEVEDLYQKHNFSHIVYCIDDNEGLKSEDIIQLSLVCNNTNTDLILFYNYVNSEVFEEYVAYQAAFSVFATNTNHTQSCVLAKRNRLVQTEGISPSFDYDLYAHWQRILSSKQSIEPMLF